MNLSKYINNECGVALMMTLWVMIFLTVIVTEFAYSMRTEVNITKNFRDSIQAYYLARAALNRGIVEILLVESENKKPHYLDPKGRLVFGKDEEGNMQEAPLRKEDLEVGTFEYILTDEESKLNINLMKNDSGYQRHRDKFKGLFMSACGLEEGSELDTIIDSIGDWTDPDDLHKDNGAEDDYYQDLEVSYHCKNREFDTIEELQLVKGMTKEIFAGIADYIRVDKESTNLNVNRNTTNELVLNIVKGEEEATNIIETRKTEPFSDISSHFSIEGIGKAKNSDVEHRIRVLFHKFKRDSRSQKEYNIYLWNDNMINIKELIEATNQAFVEEEEL